MGSLSRPYSIKRFKRLIDYLIYLLILLIERNNTPIPQCLKEYNVKNSVDLEEREITESQKSFIINSVVDTIINEIQSSSHFFIYLLYAFKVLLPKEVPILVIESYIIQGKHSWGKHTYQCGVCAMFARAASFSQMKH